MSFFNTTYSIKRPAEQVFNIPFKNQCTEEGKEYLAQGTHTISTKYYAAMQELTGLLFETKMQILFAHMQTDAYMLEDKLTDKDIQFIANIMISSDPVYNAYKQRIEEAKTHLPGCVDCRLTGKIYDAIKSINNK